MVFVFFIGGSGMKLAWRILITMSLFGASASHALVSPKDVNTFTLDNGLKVIVLEDDSIPNANMYTFWKVGSRNEAPGITGLSHFFEHMMFNGAKKYGPKMFDRTMENHGGRNNAYTTEDLTVYTNWFPSESLEIIFDLEADRIANLDINQQVLESERGVVTSERSTGLENSNWRTLSEEVKGAAFRAHPYSWSVIGHQSDIDNWTLDDLKNYHKTYYAPNNAVMVIVGAVQTAEVKKLAEQYLGPIAAQPAPRAIHTVEPAQTGERRVYVQKESVSSPNIMMAYHVPATSHQDYYALALLSDILSSGKSARLNQNLVENQIALDTATYLPQSFDANLFYLYAVAAKDIDATKLEHALIAEINKVIKEGVTEAELEKVKNQRLLSLYRTLATINGKANEMGTYEVFFGDYQKLFTAPQDFAQVTVADVQRVAATYLKRANRTVGVLGAKEDSHENDF